MELNKEIQQAVAVRFGKRVRALREKKGVSLRKFAGEVGMSPTYVSKIERGEFLPPAENKIRAIGLFLEQDADELLALAGRVPSDVTEILVNKYCIAPYLRAMRDVPAAEIEKVMTEVMRKIEEDSKTTKWLVHLPSKK